MLFIFCCFCFWLDQGFGTPLLLFILFSPCMILCFCLKVEAGSFFSNVSNGLVTLCGITSQKTVILFIHFLSMVLYCLKNFSLWLCILQHLDTGQASLQVTEFWITAHQFYCWCYSCILVYRISDCSVEWWNGWWIMNWKGFATKQSWLRWGTVLAVA